MIGFENYDVRAWLEKGLTKHFVVRNKPERSVLRQKAWKAAVILSLAACSVTSLEATAAQSAMTWNTSMYASPVVARLSDEVPIGYWPKLMASVSEWQNMEENDLALPAPII